MKNSNQSVSRIIISILALTSMCAMISCSSTGSGVDVTSVTLGKDGSVQSNIVESFEESYYDKEELQQSILSQAATYNRSVGEGSVKVEKVEVKDSNVLVQMVYAGAKDYASFNKATFYIGKAQDAIKDGYELNVVLSGVKNSQETVGRADVLAMENVTLLITDISDTIVLNGTALYVSENVTVSGKGKTVSRTTEDEKLAYIIFK